MKLEKHSCLSLVLNELVSAANFSSINALKSSLLTSPTHFSHGDADYEMLAGNGRPARFGPVQWCPETRQLTPIEDMLTPLITIDDIRPQLAKLLARSGPSLA